jgi:hypothetical protein
MPAAWVGQGAEALGAVLTSTASTSSARSGSSSGVARMLEALDGLFGMSIWKPHTRKAERHCRGTPGAAMYFCRAGDSQATDVRDLSVLDVSRVLSFNVQ